MKKHTCHLDLHQRSHYVTFGLRNWVRKLIDIQKGKLLDNQEEKLLDKQNSSKQPIPNPIRDRSGRPGITHDVISVQDERKASRFQEVSVISFNEELCSLRMT